MNGANASGNPAAVPAVLRGGAASFLRFARRIGLGPKGHYLLIGLAFLLGLLSVGCGFFLDDYAHLAAIRGQNPIASWWDIFCFAPGDPARMQSLMDTGPYPWFCLPTMKIHFFRPLSSALMALDYVVFGKHATGYHFHGALWYAALVGVVALVLRRTLPGVLGLLALFLFVVDESHVFPVLWWSNRNAVVTIALTFAGILAHLRWREEGWKPGLPLSLIGYVLGMLSGECAVSVLGYLLAYELFSGPGRFGRRLLSVAPASILVCVYLLFYKAMGYGVQGMRVYLDPLSVPFEYAIHAPARFLILSATQFFSFPAEVPAMENVLEWPSAAVGLALLVVVYWGMRCAWRDLSVEERRSMGWLMAGAALSTAPLLAPFTSGRLLLVPSIGGSAVLAVLMRHGWRVWRGYVPVESTWRGGGLAKGLLVVFAALHIVFAALTWPVLGVAFSAMTRAADRAALAVEVDETRIGQQRVVVVTAPEPVMGFYAETIRLWHDRQRALSWSALSLAPYDHVLTRTGADSFTLTLEDGEMFTVMYEELMRSPASPLVPGDVIHTKHFDVTILSCGAAGPRKLGLRFRAPLEDSSYLFLVWRDGVLRPLEIPGIHESVRLSKDAGLPDWLWP